MKYLIKLITAAIMILLFTLPVCAYEHTFEVQMPDSVNSGRSFDITVKYNGVNMLGGVWLEVVYDEEYFSFKSFSAENSTSDYENSGGKLSLICLFNEKDNNCREMKLIFTSKTGVHSAEKSFRFNCIQAVSSDLKDIDTSITPSADISMIRKSDDTDTSGDGFRSKDESDKKGNTDKNNGTKASSSKTKSDTSKKTSSKKTKSEGASSDRYTGETNSDGTVHEYGENTSSAVNQTLRIYESESRSELVIAGAVGALAIVGILFGLYKLGNIKYKS